MNLELEVIKGLISTMFAVENCRSAKVKATLAIVHGRTKRTISPISPFKPYISLVSSFNSIVLNIF